MSELTAYLRGVGLWTPAFPKLEDWVAAGMQESFGGPAAAQGKAARPAAELLHPRLRRRTSVLTRATVTALEAAVAQGGVSLDAVRFVLVSSFGEIETTVELLAQLAEPQGPVSPTKFHNSVHNTATGYLSIASGNHREATALAGGPHNLEIALLEVLAGLAIDGGDAVLLIAEELLPEPFARPDADPTFAVALHFGTEPSRENGSLDLRVRLDSAPRPGPADGLRPAGLPSMVGAVSELLRAIVRLAGDASARRESVELASCADPGVDLRWTLRLEHS